MWYFSEHSHLQIHTMYPSILDSIRSYGCKTHPVPRQGLINVTMLSTMLETLGSLFFASLVFSSQRLCLLNTNRFLWPTLHLHIGIQFYTCFYHDWSLPLHKTNRYKSKELSQIIYRNTQNHQEQESCKYYCSRMRISMHEWWQHSCPSLAGETLPLGPA